MTKVTIVGQPQEVAKLRPIVFNSVLTTDLEFTAAASFPSSCKNIELICRDYDGGGTDLMFAYNDNRREGALYLGHFNDGVV